MTIEKQKLPGLNEGLPGENTGQRVGFSPKDTLGALTNLKTKVGNVGENLAPSQSEVLGEKNISQTQEYKDSDLLNSNKEKLMKLLAKEAVVYRPELYGQLAKSLGIDEKTLLIYLIKNASYDNVRVLERSKINKKELGDINNLVSSLMGISSADKKVADYEVYREEYLKGGSLLKMVVGDSEWMNKILGTNLPTTEVNKYKEKVAANMKKEVQNSIFNYFSQSRAISGSFDEFVSNLDVVSKEQLAGH